MRSLRALARKEKNSEEIKHNWGVWALCELLIGFSGGPEVKVFEKVTIFSLKLVWYSVLKINLKLCKTPTPLLCYACNRQTKSKLEDEIKTSTFLYVFLASWSYEKQTDKETDSTIYYDCIITFFFYLILFHLS